MKLNQLLLSVVIVILTAHCKNPAEKTSANNVNTAESAGKIVTPENFIRAETDRMFYSFSQIAGGVNKFNHVRNVTPLDQQSVVRMNKDVLYSGALVDTEKGASVIFPEMPDKRYASILVIDNDHYAAKVFYKAGKYDLPNDTKYIALAVRVQVFNPKDTAEIGMVNRLKEKFIIESNSADPFPKPDWDQKSLDSLRTEYEQQFTKYDRYHDDWMGPRGTVNEETRKLACAGAWGLFPNKDATYINYNGGNLSGSDCYVATYKVPDVGGFWSITVYGKDGYMKSENAVINASNVKFNKDRTFTVHYGAPDKCPAGVKNRLDISDGWNILMRCYLPGKEVMDGSYKLPPVQLLK